MRSSPAAPMGSSPTVPAPALDTGDTQACRMGALTPSEGDQERVAVSCLNKYRRRVSHHLRLTLSEGQGWHCWQMWSSLYMHM